MEGKVEFWINDLIITDTAGGKNLMFGTKTSIWGNLFLFAGIVSPSFGASVVSETAVTLQHSNAALDGCKEGYKIIPSLQSSTFSNAVNKTCLDGDTYVIRNDKPSDLIAKVSGFAVSDTAVSINHNNATLDGCKEGYKIIPSLQGSTFSNAVNKICLGGDTYVVRNDKPSDLIAKVSGFVVSDTAVTLCDDGYLNNGTCVAYDHFGIQPNHYNLALNNNQFINTENDTCSTGYYKTNTLNLPVTVCMIAGTEVHLDWQGVDVTGTPAESCYYLGDLFAPSVEPASVPGLKFLGWRPMPE